MKAHNCESGWVLREDGQLERCMQCRDTQRAGKWRRMTPRRFWDASLDGLTQPAQVREELLGWLDGDARLEGASLLLFGPVGAGKTFAAYAVLRELFMKGYDDVRATSAVMMFRSLQPDGGAELNDYVRPEQLLIDDLGLEKASEWTDQELTAILDQRWRDCAPTIVTTNLTAKQLEQQIGRRAYDRLADGAVALSLTRQSQRARRAA